MLLTEFSQILFAQIATPAVATDNLEFSFWAFSHSIGTDL